MIFIPLEPGLLPRPQQPRQERRLVLLPRKAGGGERPTSLFMLCRRQEQATGTQLLPVLHERAGYAAPTGRRAPAALLHPGCGGRHGALQPRQLALDLAGFVGLLLLLLSLLLLLRQEGAVVIDVGVGMW